MSDDNQQVGALRAGAPPRGSALLRRLQKKADRLADAGRFQEALDCQTQAVALAPEDPHVYMRLGFLHRSLFQIDKAVRAFRRASSLDPAVPDPHEALAEAYLDAARYDDAIRESKELLRLVPNSMPARDILSAAYQQKGQIDKAIGVTSEMVVLAPLDSMSYYKRGMLHRQRGAWKEALEEMTMAAQIAPARSLERAEAEAAIEAIDRHQIGEILLLSSEDRLFQMRLSRNTQEALEERGYHVSPQAQMFLQRVALGQPQDDAMPQMGSYVAQNPRLRLYN